MLAHKIKVDPTNEKPLWQQIEEGVRNLITTGILAPGNLILSVKELAQELKINPTIVAKAYQRLVESGLLINNRWEGMLVANTQRYLTTREQQYLLQQEALRYALVVNDLGVNKEDAITQLKLALHTLRFKNGKLRFAVKLTQLASK
jgi:GntR family transcriptional regulator